MKKYQPKQIGFNLPSDKCNPGANLPLSLCLIGVSINRLPGTRCGGLFIFASPEDSGFQTEKTPQLRIFFHRVQLQIYCSEAKRNGGKINMSRVRNPTKSTIEISSGSSIDLKTFSKFFKRDGKPADKASSGQGVSEKHEKAPVAEYENEAKEHDHVETWSLVELRKTWSRRIRWLTFVGCLVAVVVQLYQCYGKLRLPPVTTHTRFHVNDSLWYPAVTICREPPFRIEVFNKYHLGASPRFTSEWRYFPWDEMTLEELYTEATFPADEVLLLYGLNGEVHHVELTSGFFFESGSCHTLTPKVTSQTAGSAAGYSILVTHSGIADEVAPEIPPSVGWHVFVHEPSETWTENKMQSLGRQRSTSRWVRRCT
ncbi:uncharacterized protein LOC105685303 isoform X2 [Athalia rosae]|uniref:uncharacterized protein LOC105685303 isoform X2 n=1 Tax=Athalia rosae TaxID=37344 RepID=UPI0020347E77|nr:uncharacterized protein LOC105685303 isoform X2 [Athalia rosae]